MIDINLNLPIDTVPTNGSTNLIDSNAVFDGLALKENSLPSIVGNSLKVLRVNAGETGKEWATISSGLTIGTTPISSGVAGRVLFQNGGNVVGQDSSLFWDNTNKRLGVGATPATNARLDIRAQGALSTDIAFRVRNSADTGNLFQINGDGSVFGNGGGGLVQNTAFGSEALKANTSGINNVAFGLEALRLNTTGDGNVAVGRDALRSGNVSSCTALGFGALQSTTGNNNTAVGCQAGNTITSGVENVSIGYTSMGQAPAKTGQRNVCIGAFAATALTSGSSNILIGRNTGSNITTGSFNTLIGENLSTSAVSTNNNVILADGQGNQVIRKDANHNQILGVESVLATNATNGFTYIPTCAGIPTGVPAASFTGKEPIAIDSTNNKMYIYTNAAWVALN